jgi:hypothetical protein
MMQEPREADPLELLVPLLAERERAPEPELKAALAAEIRQLCDQGQWGPGQSEIERLYALFPGPNTRRRALQKLLKRLAAKFPKRFVEIYAMCFEDVVCLEVSMAESRAELDTAPVAQGQIMLSLFRDKPPRGEVAGGV